MKTCYVIDAIRTPIGKYRGKLASVRPDDLLAVVLKNILERNPTIDVHCIEDVIVGAANQAGEDNRNVARMASLLAGLPVTVAGNTVNRLCASGLQAIMDAARCIMCNEGDIYLAGGVESMSRAPWVTAKMPKQNSNQTETVDSTIGWRFVNEKLAKMYYPYNMGQTAENIAQLYHITREAQDSFAYASHQKYFYALENGIWAKELVPVNISNSETAHWLKEDEPPKHTSLDKLAALKPAFLENGTVTAGNSSGINDGAAALILASEKAVKDFELRPIARIVSMAVAGVHPDIMGMAPIPATQKALKRAGITINDLQIIELNEAFAAQSIACIQQMELDTNLVNVNGGAIAIGNPLGCCGARIATTLLHEMKRRGDGFGLATLCVGVGQGAAMVFEGL